MDRRRRSIRSSTKRLLLQDEQEGKESSSQVCINSRVQENKLIVIDELKFDEIKTKNFKAVMDNLKVNKAYVVLMRMMRRLLSQQEIFLTFRQH